jgi:hypothetical protein
MRSLAVIASVVACASLATAAACGARTGLQSSSAEVVVDSGSKPDALPPVKCTPGTFELTLASTQMMLVVDRSGSMDFDLNGQAGGGQNSRWRVLERALAPVLNALTPKVELGAKFFPDPIGDIQVDDACAVASSTDVSPRLASANEILRVFANTRPIGGTPTSDALRITADFLAQQERRVLARYMVLATDGAPNCNEQLDNRTCVCTGVTGGPESCRSNPNGPAQCLDDVRAIRVVADAFTKSKIPTFVIGLGAPSELAFTRTLNNMAQAGGRPRPGPVGYYEATSPEALNAALQSVKDGIATCTYVTPSRPNDPNAITVQIDGRTVVRSQVNGWDWVDQDYGAIAFFGTACDTLRLGGAGRAVKGTVACKDP